MTTNNQQVFLFPICVTASHSQTPGVQSNEHTTQWCLKTASKCIHAPFRLKTSRERYVFLLFVAYGYDAFSFSFYISSYANTCLQKNKSLGMGQACFHNQGLPYSSCMDIGWNDEIKFCPTCFPQFFSEVASTV